MQILDLPLKYHELRLWDDYNNFRVKQAENGLQSRSSENGKIAVWHYGLKLQGGRGHSQHG